MEGGGSIFDKVNQVLNQSWLCGPLRSCAQSLEPDGGGGKCLGPVGRAFFGALFYGFLFVPYTFALLQQTMIEKRAQDPFAKEGSPSRSAWATAFIFLAAMMVYCLFAFLVRAAHRSRAALASSARQQKNTH